MNSFNVTQLNYKDVILREESDSIMLTVEHDKVSNNELNIMLIDLVRKDKPILLRYQSYSSKIYTYIIIKNELLGRVKSTIIKLQKRFNLCFELYETIVLNENYSILCMTTVDNNEINKEIDVSNKLLTYNNSYGGFKKKKSEWLGYNSLYVYANKTNITLLGVYNLDIFIFGTMRKDYHRIVRDKNILILNDKKDNNDLFFVETSRLDKFTRMVERLSCELDRDGSMYIKEIYIINDTMTCLVIQGN